MNCLDTLPPWSVNDTIGAVLLLLAWWFVICPVLSWSARKDLQNAR